MNDHVRPTGVRSIPDTFMNNRTDPDGEDENGAYIDCSKIAGGHDASGICGGFSAGSTNDASGLAVIRYRPRGSAAVITARYVLGNIHEVDLERLYASDANGVIIYFYR